MEKPGAEMTVTAEELGLRELPKGWAGAPLAQLASSARKIVEQSEATGGSGDPRLEAALKILEFKDGLKAGRKRQAIYPRALPSIPERARASRGMR